ncbi:acyltransferase [Novosphingobium sp.]|uniref:acyltransferase family protein n=1 Tax=Novosphingobium sp. TaxID=1874826 RepID=UPI00261BD16E|nr:acyltransferase [Novosphingobium sp.]
MRFHTLDGMRGIAALVVLVFHIVQQRTLAALPFAGLAVDFFYVLSGFVVAHSYEARLAGGALSLRAFAQLRFVRLYPLAFLGILLGTMLAALAAAVKGSVSPADVATAALFAFLLLPSFVFPQWPTAYPFNPAAWSLTFEALANVLFACIARWLSNAVLIAILLAGGAALAWLAYANAGISGGHEQATVLLGVPRVIFPFFAGVLLRRLPAAPGSGVLAGGGLMLVLLAVLLAPIGWGAGSSLACVVVLFPLLVWLGIANRPGPRLERAFAVIGALSYPLYITQAAVLRLGLEVVRRYSLSPAQFALFAVAEAACALALAWFAMRWFDAPVQQILRRRDQPRTAPTGARGAFA